jgi:molybdopterin-guanine dinucleotide biosynthesis protein A
MDKATLVVNGMALGRRSIDALLGASIERVVVVGGTTDFGLELIPDDEPGSGPLGGLLSAFGATGDADLVVLPCDLPAVDAPAVVALVEFARQTPVAQVVIGTLEGRPAWPVGYWRRAGEGHLRAAVAGGVRSFGAAVESLPLARVELGSAIADADEPGDLPGTGTLAGGGHNDHGGAW